jgi:NDP-sugar pyrophosphorylase family protein
MNVFRLCKLAGIAMALVTTGAFAGTFEATLGDREYSLEVVCDAFGENMVMFRSDEAHYASARDTDGDGIAVIGQPGIGNRLTLALELLDNDERFLINSGIPGQELELVPGDNSLRGQGRMLGESGSDRDIEFTLVCP